MQTGYRKAQRRLEVLVERTEVGGEQQLRSGSRRGQGLVCRDESRPRAIVEIEDERGLVDLDPGATGGCQAPHHLRIDLEQLRQERERLGCAILALGESEIRHGSKQHGTRLQPQTRRFEIGIQRFGRRERERSPSGELRHQVMIVRVEPFGHLESDGGIGSARHREHRLERDGAAVPAETLGDRADHDARIEHVVVEGEVVARKMRDAELMLTSPVRRAKRRGLAFERGRVDRPRPKALEEDFELAASADARKSKRRDRYGHETPS